MGGHVKIRAYRGLGSPSRAAAELELFAGSSRCLKL